MLRNTFEYSERTHNPENDPLITINALACDCEFLRRDEAQRLGVDSNSDSCTYHKGYGNDLVSIFGIFDSLTYCEGQYLVLTYSSEARECIIDAINALIASGKDVSTYDTPIFHPIKIAKVC